MPPKRGADELAETKEEVKKFRSALDSMADEWVCPITFELPLDPVFAEDGRTYERCAIEEHIRTQGAELKSPLTNEPMGTRLTANVQGRNTIEKLVRTGVLGGDKAERWLARLKGEEKVKAMRARAEGGDAVAMYNLGNAYNRGKHGLEQDDAAAYGWYKRGADLGEASCLWQAGVCLAVGYGVEQSITYGVMLVTQGAYGGSAGAADFLGNCFDRGYRGLPKDLAQAKAWYEKVASAKDRDINAEGIESAAKRARELSNV